MCSVTANISCIVRLEAETHTNHYLAGASPPDVQVLPRFLICIPLSLALATCSLSHGTRLPSLRMDKLSTLPPSQPRFFSHSATKASTLVFSFIFVIFCSSSIKPISPIHSKLSPKCPTPKQRLTFLQLPSNVLKALERPQTKASAPPQAQTLWAFVLSLHPTTRACRTTAYKSHHQHQECLRASTRLPSKHTRPSPPGTSISFKPS